MPQRKKGMLALSGTGDDGTSGLLGGGRVAKDDLRLEAAGCVDEASSALGLARSLASSAHARELIEELQRGLYKAGAELATNPERNGTFPVMTEADVAHLEAVMSELEADTPMPAGFILPGATPGSAAIDLARATVRRAERRCVALATREGGGYRELRRYLNRLSLLLFVLGRYEEGQSGMAAKAAREEA